MLGSKHVHLCFVCVVENIDQETCLKSFLHQLHVPAHISDSCACSFVTFLKPLPFFRCAVTLKRNNGHSRLRSSPMPQVMSCFRGEYVWSGDTEDPCVQNMSARHRMNRVPCAFFCSNGMKDLWSHFCDASNGDVWFMQSMNLELRPLVLL